MADADPPEETPTLSSESTSGATITDDQSPGYAPMRRVREMIAHLETRTGESIDRLQTSIQQQIGNIQERIAEKPSTAKIAGIVFSGVIGTVAIWAFAGDRFDSGVQLTSATIQYAVEARRATDELRNDLRRVTDDTSRQIQDLAKQNQELARQMQALVEVMKQQQAQPVKPQAAPETQGKQ